MSNVETVNAEAKGGAQAPPPSAGNRDARRTAAAVLEVLAGASTPTEAATALGVSLQRYYVFESRALEGLVTACEPRSKGRSLSPEREFDKLQRECERLRKEGLRYQSLARTAQRAAGFTPPPSRLKQSSRGKRRRKPVVRALVAVARLKEEAGKTPGNTTPPAQPAAQPEGSASARAGRTGGHEEP